MKKSLRIVSAFLLLVMLTGMLAACVSGTPETPTGAENTEQTAEVPTETAGETETQPAQTEPAPTEPAATAAEEEPHIIEPDEILQAKLYYTGGNRQADVANGKIFRYNVVKGQNYYLTTSLTAQDGGFPLVCYFNAQDKLVGTEFMNTPTQPIEAVEAKLTIPSDAAYIFVNARGVDAIMVSGVRQPVVPEGGDTAETKEISILFVGNSLTQDGIAYLPYVLKNYFPEVKFRFYMWYIGGATLLDTYNRFTDNKTCDIFSVAENSMRWSNSAKTMSWILKNYEFDIVCMQEYLNYRSSYTAADLKYWNNCRNYIVSNYAGDNGLEFVTLFHAPKRDRADEIFSITEQVNKMILTDTIADDIIPIGVAVKYAMGTTLDVLGDQKHLSPDGTHTQEGLPCLVQTYVALLWLLERLGISRSIYGLPVKITAQEYAKINVPGANLGSGVIPGTDAQNLLAQEVAIMAYKEAKRMFAAELP